MRKQKTKLIKIGDLAQKVGVLPSKIRFWTLKGLLKEDNRSQGNCRLYREQKILKRIKTIQKLKEERLTLDEIKQKLGTTNGQREG